MSFNIFGQATKDDIRVGYISTDRGLVEGVSVCEANEYAAKNPGTTFIFRTRDIIRYLNINGVNELTPQDLSATTQGCDGIQLETECGPPKVYFYGGGGVGVQGNPIIGVDGSLLAVDLVYGGNGYQYAPIVEVKDGCGIGAGAVIRSVIGEVVETVEVYDQEADFENYEICESSIPQYGQKFNPDGSVVGVWDPTLYANLSEDPIRREIRDYQEFLQKLSKPWWTTRKEAPLRIISPDNVSRTKVDVTDAAYRARQIEKQNGGTNFPTWNDFMNKYAISPVPPSNVVGSDFGTYLFIFEWEEDFPYDGQYTFRGCADGAVKDLYIDGDKLTTLASFNEAPVKVKKFLPAGVHKIRIDLQNGSLLRTQPKDIFNTKDYINKADRKLWRTSPGLFGGGSFLDEYGILPFDMNSEEAKTSSFDGVHVIRWQYVNFPEDGKYDIEVMVDDDVDIYIGNRAGGGRAAIGNGLRSVDQGGDEVIIRKKGFTASGKGTGKSLETRFFRAGTYRIRAELKQLRGKPLSGGNPMALAIRIRSTTVTEQTVLRQPWNDNPMGVSVTIDAPLPPIPVEPVPEQEGRCPNNPIWSTRFPGSERWWPVSYSSAMKDAGVTKWSEFLDRYAVSPVPPLIDLGTDGSGVVHQNSWNLDIPYDGFYRFAVQRDETARIYVDNNLAFDVKTAGDMLWKNYRNKPKFKNVFLTKGMHSISIELEQRNTETYEFIDQKIFRTKDWQAPAPAPTTSTSTSQVEEWVRVDDVFVPPIVSGGRGGDGSIKIPSDASFHRYNEGTYYKGKKIRPGGDWNDTNPNTNYIEWDSNTRLTLGSYRAGAGQRFAIAVWQKQSKTVTSTVSTQTPSSGTTSSSKNGVTYSGPELFAYKDNRWSTFMNNHSISPYLPPLDQDNPAINGPRTYTWSGVKFPESGQYEIAFQADNSATLFIGGKEVVTARQFNGNVVLDKVNLIAGTYDVVVNMENTPDFTDVFVKNPVGFALVIKKKIRTLTGLSKSWVENPIGISAILIPPPCPKRIRGKGVVTDIIVDDPGNGYPVVQNDVSPDVTTTYPISLRLKSVEVEDSGINYSCGVDEIVIEPSNGAVLDYECDTFGRITRVKVLNPGLGFTRYPNITMPSNTGVNATFRPQFEVVRDPIVVDEDKLIQVTDLVGLKQTGYVDGRAYYGAVFYKEGVRYAGFYETPGQLVQVYNTLQESIDAEVTTPPSAIQRQGTDISSNDPRLNIPNTPDDLIQG